MSVLLRQPHGFEGFGPLGVLVPAKDAAVSNRNMEVVVGVDFDAVSAPSPGTNDVGGERSASAVVWVTEDCTSMPQSLKGMRP